MAQPFLILTWFALILSYWIPTATTLVSNVTHDQSEKTTILDLYYATNGWEWYISWNITLLEQCINDTQCSICDLHLYNITCDETNRITFIDIQYNNLQGTIPDSIGNLAELTVLALAGNKLYGTIPESIWNLTKLTALFLEVNELEGTISNSIGNLIELTYLTLGNNKLSGSIPDSFSNLTKLFVLYLWGNELNGTLPDGIGNLTSLEYLSLGENKLSGTIPYSIGNLKKVSLLYLYENELSGSIPDSICNLIELTSFAASHSKLNGTIPNCIGNLTKLSVLYLYNSQLTGTIPNSLGNLTKLTFLDIADNELNGTIPESIGNLNELTALSLAPNNLIGTIPYSIGNLTKLMVLHIWDTEITGTIPDSMSNLIDLTDLGFGENKLNGTIPNWIGNLNKLSTVYLWSNELSGTIPYSIGNLRELTVLELGENKLSGVIPNSIGNCTKLYKLFLWNNELTGTIPYAIGNLTNLSSLYMWGNKLNGGIPNSIGNLTNLQHILLTDNELDGTIPDSIGDLTDLQVFNIENNDLYTNDIAPLLSKLFDDKHNLRLISIANNPRIKGDLSKLTMDYSYSNIGNTTNDSIKNYNYSYYEYYSSTLKYFIGYNCDLYGSLPKHIQFSNLQYFIIHKNRLSCQLPNQLLLNTNNASVVVLLSNLFQVKSSNQFVPWMDSSLFQSVNSIYITNEDLFESTMIVSITGIITGVGVFIQLFIFAYNVFCKKSHNRNNDSETIYIASKNAIAIELFLNQILSLGKGLSQLKYLLCMSVLVFLYSIHSTYFQCLPILDQLSLSYYETTSDVLDWILIFVLAISYTILCNNVFGLQNNQSKILDHNKALINDSDRETMIFQPPTVVNNNPRINNISCKDKMFAVVGFAVYFILLILATVFVIFSIIVDNLPNDNIFGLDELETKAIQSSLPLILTVNTAIIIPQFVDSCYKCYNTNINNNNYNDSFSSLYVSEYRAKIILLLRTFSIIIVPFISSLIILPNCGNNWFYFWNQCGQRKKNQLDVGYTNHDIVLNQNGSAVFQYSKLFSSSDICQSGFNNNNNNIRWNKCLRTFSSQWSLVINKKLCIMIVSPIFVVSWNYVKHKIVTWVKKCILKKRNININSTCNRIASDNEYAIKLKVDLEYAMFLTKFESMIIWFPISPFVFPLTITSIYTNYYIYYLMIDKYQWKLKPFNINVRLPIGFIWIAIILSQIYVCVFIIVCIGNQSCGYTLVAILILIDILYFLKYYGFNCCDKKNNQDQLKEHDKFQKL